VLNETIEIYRDAVVLTPAFLWIALLQMIAIVVGFVLLVIPGLLAIRMALLRSFALVFDNRRSWHALLYSRDLTRGALVEGRSENHGLPGGLVGLQRMGLGRVLRPWAADRSDRANLLGCCLPRSLSSA